MFHLFLSSFTAKAKDVMLPNPYLYFLNQSGSIICMNSSHILRSMTANTISQKMMLGKMKLTEETCCSLSLSSCDRSFTSHLDT